MAAIFADAFFQMHFVEWKWENSDSSFTETCSQESNWQYTSISSANGLAPNGWQAITWTNDDPVHWRIYAALGGDELTGLSLGPSDALVSPGLGLLNQ